MRRKNPAGSQERPLLEERKKGMESRRALDFVGRERPAAEPPREPGLCNILLVDDDEENLFALEAMLYDLKQNLVRARSGEEALKCLLNQEFAVILLDVRMPGMDGFETAEMIRRRDRSRHVPIIFVTGVSMEESQVFRGYSLGAVDYIFKPILPEILKSKVAVFVELHRKSLQIENQARVLRRWNEELKNEIEKRKRAEAELQAAHDGLEGKVRERTAELTQSNAELTREVARRRRAEEGLAKQAEELSRSNAELEQFAYVISHDLQEPLRMITSYAELLEKRYKTKLDADAGRFIDYIVDGAVRMKASISDLLEYARLDSRLTPASPADCAAVCERALSNLELLIREKNAVVTRGSLPQVTGDPVQLELLFQNLIGNALKFCAERRPAVHISARLADGNHLFSVKDNGIGIEPEHRERIFELFQRLHTQEEYAGSGIGLSVCRKIVQRHGGRIWVESEPGRGSTFHFTIPRGKEVSSRDSHD